MRSVGTAIASSLAKLDPEKARLLRNARNNERYAAAARRVFSDNPDAGEYVLAHTNGLYLEKSAPPPATSPNGASRLVIHVYLDDATARAELNARREMLLFSLRQDGMHLDEMVIRNATWGMRERHLFPEALAHMESFLAGCGEEGPRGGSPSAPAGASGASRCNDDAGNRESRPIQRDASRLLETFKRACCLAFDDLDAMEAVLDAVEGASLEEPASARRAKRGKARYWCHLYLRDFDATEALFDERARQTVISRAKALGLDVAAIQLHRSPQLLAGRRAFPRIGHPVPLSDADLQQMHIQPAGGRPSENAGASPRRA